MARDGSKEPRFERGSAAVRQQGLESPADFPRLALLVRAAQKGDAAAVDALVTVLTPTVLHVIRALWGARRLDVEAVTGEVLIAIFGALPSWRGECTLLHFATRIAARRAAAHTPAPRSWLERIGVRRWTHPVPFGEALAERRRAFFRTFFGELPEGQGEAMVLRLALGYSLDEISLITTTPVATVRNRLRLAKEALRARIEADPEWETLWSDDP
ncbi:MAG: sigma factor-like helix-turn-helix DNA-binding protein [Polyangiaceae bacterium]